MGDMRFVSLLTKGLTMIVKVSSGRSSKVTQDVGIMDIIGTVCGCRLNEGKIEYHIKIFNQKVWVPASYVFPLQIPEGECCISTDGN